MNRDMAGTEIENFKCGKSVSQLAPRFALQTTGGLIKCYVLVLAVSFTVQTHEEREPAYKNLSSPEHLNSPPLDENNNVHVVQY